MVERKVENTDVNEKLYTVKEVAEILHIKPDTLKDQVINKGKLPFLHVTPRKVLIRDIDLKKYLDSCLYIITNEPDK